MESLSRLSLDDFRSPADKKCYRLVTLSNGLEVLLIQSSTIPTSRGDTQSTETCSLSSTDGTDADSVQDEDDGNDRTPPLAAACLAVDVGSLSDPEDLPGLAHYLEHMIFMGSEKYPAEDAFDAFLSAHGGSSNGATECESTRFLFDVDAAHLEPALDMFAHFFVAPLLRQEVMERELKAVESEFQRARNNDAVRLQQVMCETSAPGHPYSRCFTWGNNESLHHQPNREGINVRDSMVAFYRAHYVAPRMKLCVYGCESLDILEQFVTQSFSGIPSYRVNCDESRVDKLSVPYGVDAGHRPTILRVDTVAEKRCLRMYWMVPTMLTSYRQKPWLYVAHLLGHEGPASATSMLKRRKWATDVVAGTSDEDCYEFGSFGTVFEVRVSLTDEGLKCWDEVVQLILDALHEFTAMATENTLPSWVYEELRSSSEISFRFQEDTKTPAEICRGHTERMLPHRNVQREDLLQYDVIQGVFDATAVRTLLAGLTVSNVRVVLQASSCHDDLGTEEIQSERWFGTRYTVNAVSDAVITAWSQTLKQPTALSRLPTPNPFMPQEFSVPSYDLAAQPNEDIPPELILSTSTTQLWFKQDHTFLLPKVSVSFLVLLPFLNAETLMLAELHVELVRNRLQHTLDQADAANFDVELDLRDGAIEVVVFGFNDTMPALVRAVMKEVLHPSGIEVSEIMSELTLARDDLEREYQNTTLSPRSKAYELRLQMLESNAITANDKLEALNDREGRDAELARDLARFVVTVLGRTDDMKAMRCLVVGNMSQEAAISLVLGVETFRSWDGTSVITPEPDLELEPVQQPTLLSPRCHTLALPPSANGLLVRRMSERVGERNSVVEVYFQIGKVDPEDRAYLVLLRALLAQPLFHELRTKQQLGYTVACSIRDTHGVLGLSVSVQSASHAAGAVAKQLDAYLHEDFLEYLRSEKRLSPKRFTTHVQSLRRDFSRLDSTMVEQSERYWEEIVSGRLEFDANILVAQALESCTRQGLLVRYQCWLLGNSRCCSACTYNSEANCNTSQGTSRIHGPRKLRVHVVGTGSPLKPLEHLVPPDKTPQIIAGDLREFKRELQCHCDMGPKGSISTF